jgi:hypothetical protein
MERDLARMDSNQAGFAGVVLSLLLVATALAQQEPLTIITQPRSQSVSPGASVTLRVFATPDIGTSLQWWHDNADIPGATNKALVLTNAALADAGEYWAVATRGDETAQSKSATLNIDPTFTKITAGPVATDGGDSSGAAWTDYDGDGFADLFVGNGGTRNYLYRNNGDGTFTKITNAPPVKTSGFGASWADFDNDGWPDLFVAERAANYLYRNNGDGTFTKVTPFVSSVGSRSWSGSWADYDRDGWLDLFISNGTGNNNELLHNNGDGTFARVTAGRIVHDGGTSISAAWQDYDRDGWPDLYVANNLNSLGFLYRNLGGGAFERTTNAPLATDRLEAIVGDWGDYDNDGWPDLAVAVFGRCALYRNRGDGTFERQTTGPFVTNSQTSQIVQWADYDNDGFLDLFSANDSGQDNALFHNNGDGTFTEIKTGSPVHDGGNSAGAAWADYDNNGFLDLFVANWEGFRPNFLYRNNGNGNHWLKVQCVGSASNRSGIGARVRVTAMLHGQPVRQLREISGGTGFGQGELLAHFGLADAAELTSVVIEWPSGTVQTLGPLPSNQKLVVHEPPRIRQLRRSGDSWQIEFLGVPHGAYRLDAGDDLLDWSPSGDAEPLPAPGGFQVTIPADDAALRRFFRVVEL